MRTLLTTLAIAALTGVGGMAGDTIAIRTKVPFDFTVGDRRVPAGDYRFERIWSPRVILISSFDTGTALSVPHDAVAGQAAGRPNTLVFNQYGDRYFLREIRLGDGQSGVQLPRSRSEKEAMSAQRPVRTTLTASVAR
jgi:hypothetical protein